MSKGKFTEKMRENVVVGLLTHGRRNNIHIFSKILKVVKYEITGDTRGVGEYYQINLGGFGIF